METYCRSQSQRYLFFFPYHCFYVVQLKQQNGKTTWICPSSRRIPWWRESTCCREHRDNPKQHHSNIHILNAIDCHWLFVLPYIRKPNQLLQIIVVKQYNNTFSKKWNCKIVYEKITTCLLCFCSSSCTWGSHTTWLLCFW